MEMSKSNSYSYKGGIELAMQEFPAIDNNGNDDSLMEYRC
jgi:hypothetical protein